MARPLRWSVVGLAAWTCSVSTAAADERPLPLPASHAVTRIVVSAEPGSRTVKDVTDPHVIRQFLAFLAARNDRWQEPFATLPTAQWTIRLEGGDGVLLVLWLGPGWVGAREGGGTAADIRLRTLPQTDRTELIRILGVTSR